MKTWSHVKLTTYFNKPRRQALLIAAIALCLLLPLWWLINRQYRIYLLDQQRTYVESELETHGHLLTSLINSRFDRLLGLKAFTEIHKNSPQIAIEFEDFARELYKGISAIRNLTIAPNGINQYVYPLEGNENVSGHNLFTDPRPVVRADMQRVKETGDIVITGPYKRRQGGVGLMARQAVYDNNGDFWGVVSMVLDMPSIIAETGLTDDQHNLELALRDQTSQVLIGREQLFAEDIAIARFQLQDGYWELAGRPRQGWEASILERTRLLQFTTLLIMLLFTGILYLTVSRQARLSETVERRTTQLNQTNQALEQKINERKQIEQKLVFQAKLLNSVRESVVATDLNGNIIYWSNGAQALYGYAAKEVMGCSIESLIVEPDNRQAEIDRLQQVIDTNEWRGQYAQQRKDGSQFWADTVISLIKDERGQPSGFIGIDRDISDKQQLIAELQASEQKYRLLAENATDIIVTLDTNLNITYISPSVKGVMGLSPRELLGQPAEKIVTPAAYQQILSEHHKFQAGTQSDQTITLEFEIHPKNKPPLWAEINATMLIENEQHVGYLANVRDVTQRRKAEAALRESARRFRTVLTNVDLIALMLDTNGNITFANDFLLKLTGWERADVLGKNWFNIFIPPAIRADVAAIFQNTLEKRKFPAHYKNKILTRNGQLRLINWSNTVYLNSQGQIIGITSLGTDITERKRAEQQIKASLQEKEVLLREIHHRVKNNLQIISSLLTLQADSIKDDSVRHALQDSRSRVKSMAMVHETLYRSENLAQIDAKNYFETVARHVFSIYRHPYSNPLLNFDIDDIMLNLDTAIPCGLIVNELVSNALKYAFPSDTDGPPPPTAYQISVKLHWLSANQYQLVVSDNGIGLPPNLNLRESSTLGLKLVHILVQQLNGQLEINTELGVTYTISFQQEMRHDVGLSRERYPEQS